MCPDEKKGCSARDLLSKDIKYVLIGEILTELHIPEHIIIGIHRNGKMPNYLLFNDIVGKNP